MNFATQVFPKTVGTGIQFKPPGVNANYHARPNINTGYLHSGISRQLFRLFMYMISGPYTSDIQITIYI